MREKENTIIRLVLIRMFGFFVGAIIDLPQTTAKKTGDQWSPLQTDFGRDILFSLPICVITGLHRRAGACSRRNLGHGGTKAPPYKGFGLCPKHL